MPLWPETEVDVTAALQPVEAISRLGTETAFDVLARAEALAATGRDVINLGIGQPDFKTPPHIVEAAVKALRDGHHGYTASPGVPELRRSVVEDIAQRRGADVDPARVVVVPGGKVTMFFAILMFGELGAETRNGFYGLQRGGHINLGFGPQRHEAAAISRCRRAATTM